MEGRSESHIGRALPLPKQHPSDEVIPRAVGVKAGFQPAIVVDLGLPVDWDAKAIK